MVNQLLSAQDLKTQVDTNQPMMSTNTGDKPGYISSGLPVNKGLPKAPVKPVAVPNAQPIGAIAGVNAPSPIQDVVKQAQNNPAMQKDFTNAFSPKAAPAPQQNIPVVSANADIKQPLLDLGATILADQGSTPEEIQAKFPEFSHLDKQVFLDLGATLQANPDITPDEIMQKFPELSKAKQKTFDEMSTFGKIMYIPKDEADKQAMPRWKKILDVGTVTQEDATKMGWTPEDTAASAAFIGEFPKMIGNISSMLVSSPLNRSQTAQTPELSKNLKDWGEKAQQEVYDAMGTEKGSGGLNEDAAAFVAQIIPTLLVPEGKIAEVSTELLSKAPYLGKLLENPTVRKIIKGAITGMVGMETFTATTEGENASPLELGLGAGFGGVLPAIASWAKAIAPSVANKLMVSGIMNPARMGYITDKLIAEGVDGAEQVTAETVGKVLLDNGIKGSKNDIVQQTAKLAKDNQNAVDSILAKSERKYTNKTAGNLLDSLAGEYEGGISNVNKGKYDRVIDLANKNKKEGLTLTELNEVKRMVWDLKPFTASGKVKVSMSDLSAANSELKTFIEKEAENSIDGLEKDTIKILNNRTQFFNAVSDAVNKKELSEARAEIISFLAGRSPGAIVGGIAGYKGGHGDWKTTLAGVILGGLTGSTKAKTALANKIAEVFSLREQTLLSRFIQKGGAEALEPKLEAKLNTFFEDTRQNLALPSPETVTPSNMGTAANPIVGKAPKVNDITEIPLQSTPKVNDVSPSSSVSDVVPPANGGLETPVAKEVGPKGLQPNKGLPEAPKTVKLSTEQTDQPAFVDKGPKELPAKENTKGLGVKKFSPEEAKAYQTKEIKRLDRDFITGKINKQEYIDQRGALRQDMKYISRGIDPKKLKAAKTHIEEGVVKGLENLPSKDFQPLYEEARKYKSAEEFIKAHGELQYHGSNADIKERKVGQKTMRSEPSSGIYFSPDKKIAENFARDNKNAYGVGNVYEARLGIKNPKEATSYMQMGTLKKADVELAIKEGYDGFHFKPAKGDIGKEERYAIYPERIKTDTQLKQIREEANLPGKGLQPKPTNKGLQPKVVDNLTETPKSKPSSDGSANKEMKPLYEEASKRKNGEQFYERTTKETRDKLREKGIRYKEDYVKFYNENVSKKPEVLDTINPTGSVLVEYAPQKRATLPLGDNITTLDKTMGVSPDKEITIYRGTVKSQKSIVPGDFVTTNYDLAKSYSGEGNVIEMKVKAKDVLDDITEPLGEEYIYRPSSKGLPSKDLQPLYEEARKYKSAEEFVKNNYINQDFLGGLKNNIEKNNGGVKGKVSDVFQSKELKKEFGPIYDYDIMIVDKNHPSLNVSKDGYTAIAGIDKNKKMVILRGGMRTNNLIDTLLEEIGHGLRGEKGRLLDSSKSFNEGGLKSYSENVGEMTADKFKKYIQDTYIYNIQTESQLKQIREEANKSQGLQMKQESVMLKAPEDALIQEARKYKSAEEFVNKYSQDESFDTAFGKKQQQVLKEDNNLYYHGTTNTIDGNLSVSKSSSIHKEGGIKAVYLTKDKSWATNYTKNNPSKLALVKVDDIKVFNDWDGLLKDADEGKVFRKATDGGDSTYWLEEQINARSPGILETKEFVDYIKSKGYNAFPLLEEGRTGIALLDDSAKVISQSENPLKQIREEANK